MKAKYLWVAVIWLIGACGLRPTEMARMEISITPAAPASATPTAPTATRQPNQPTQTVMPTQRPAPTRPENTATPTEIPYYITATVWITDPIVPILAYHQFAPDYAEFSKATKVRWADFRAELQKLYENGYSVISLQGWLDGDLRAPAGKRPLILTMDDLFYNNQISLTEDGTPSTETGLGIAWQFYQEHPDFGFHWALFSVFGEKLYADPDKADWKDKLAAAVVWCIEHDAQVYNHTFEHVRLDLTQPQAISWELMKNDQYLRDLLVLAGREDLIPRLGNLFALPFGIWPATNAGIKALYDYTTPEGRPLQAILEVDYVYRPKFAAPPYSPSFDRWHVPRIVATLGAIDFLAEARDKIPVAQSCTLGPLDQAKASDPAILTEQIRLALDQQRCPVGIYATQGLVFRAQPGQVELIYSPSRGLNAGSADGQPGAVP